MREATAVPEVHVFPFDAAPMEGAGDTEFALDAEELGHAIASSPWWEDMQPASLIVKKHPEPVLAIVGHFDEIHRLRLNWLRSQLRDVVPRMKRLTYEQAEQACACLADALVARLGSDGVRSAQFIAIPRGGFLVLGMLSYLLDLDHAQLEGRTEPDAPLVVVDDIVLTGHRFHRFLKTLQHERVVLASLYSTPAVRRAIVEQTARVTACISAHDLQDHAETLLGEGYRAWRARWSRRGAGASYWLGRPDHVCFPWSEPDLTFWNDLTQREERGWHLAPPDSCLEHRAGRSRGAHVVQVQPEPSGALAAGADILYGFFGETVMVANTRTGDTVRLAGVAADMWRAVVETGDTGLAAATLAPMYEVGLERLETDLGQFVHELVQAGLIVDRTPERGVGA